MKITSIFAGLGIGMLALLLAAIPAASSAQGRLTEFTLPLDDTWTPLSMTPGPDGALWFVVTQLKSKGSPGDSKIGRISTKGAVTLFSVPTRKANALAIVAGPDDALWFTESGPHRIGRIDVRGRFREFPLSDPRIAPSYSIALGSDGALWFPGPQLVGRITTAGAVSTVSCGGANCYATDITPGPDGALWLTGTTNSPFVARLATTGEFTSYPVPQHFSPLSFIVSGPAHALWFSEYDDIGSITVEGAPSFHHDFKRLQFYSPDTLTLGPDGALWFAYSGPSASTGYIERYDPLTRASELVALPENGARASGIAAGPDKNVWFAEVAFHAAPKIGRLTVTP